MIVPKNVNPLPQVTRKDLEEILSHSCENFRSLRGARLLITGGTGFVGRWLLESICYANQRLNAKIQAVVLSRTPQKFSLLCPHLAGAPYISLIQGDIRKFRTPRSNFSHMIHAAADVAKYNNALETFDVTAFGTRSALEFARIHNIRDVLLLSSGAVYGQHASNAATLLDFRQTALDVASLDSAYGLGKIVTEWLGKAYTSEYNLRCKVARIFTVLGPYLTLDGRFAVGNFIRDALCERTLIIKGDGTPQRAYLYATDMVTWLWTILIRGDTGVTYNVGAQQAISTLELAQLIAKILNKSPSAIQILGQEVPSVAPAHYVPDTKLTRTKLNLSVSVPVEDALQRTITWHQTARNFGAA